MEKKRVMVVGAGIVGVAAALHLQRRGFSVALIDRGEPGAATSSGSAGVIAAGAVVPVQFPGMLRQIPSMLRDPDGPLVVDPLFVLRRAKWFAAYLRCSRAGEVRRIAKGLSSLTRGAWDEHFALAQNTAGAPWIKAGDHIYIYPDRAGFEAESFSFEILAKRGIHWSEVEADELRELEPDLSPQFRFAIRLPGHGVALNPARLVKGLAESFAAEGGEIVRAEVRRLDPNKRELTTDSAPMSYDALVVAAGPWSAALARDAGVHAPLISERGYHVFFRNPDIRHNHALKVSTGKFIATPMSDGTRIAGIVEFKPPDAPPDPRVIARLKRHARRLFPSARLEDASEWVGRRPALPDSLPVIGPAPNYPDVFLAFGHHHIGLTTGPKTGKLIAQLIAKEAPDIDIAPFSPGRFA